MGGRCIRPARGSPDFTVEAPPSKSVTHRALVAAALAKGRSRIIGPLDSEDTRFTRDGLSRLGIVISDDPDGWIVEGGGGRVPGGGSLRLGASGTSMRFLLAVAALGERPSELDGVARLRERPVAELAAALETLGAEVSLDPATGGLPARAGGTSLRGGEVEVSVGHSSQFASALLLIGSSLPGGLDLRLAPPTVSMPYVELTEKVLEDFGAEIARPQALRRTVRPRVLQARTFRVEGDHSSASYFLAAGAILGGRVRVERLRPDSPQPDGMLSKLLVKLGASVRTGEEFIEVRGGKGVPGFHVDLRDAPDLAPTVAVLALVADGPCRLSGVGHLRLKESDRLALLVENLRAMGRPARATESTLEVGPPETGGIRGARIRTGSDHRMAMAFAVAGLRVPGVEVDDPDCVAKSWPGFWECLEGLGG